MPAQHMHRSIDTERAARALQLPHNLYRQRHVSRACAHTARTTVVSSEPVMSVVASSAIATHVTTSLCACDTAHQRTHAHTPRAAAAYQQRLHRFARFDVDKFNRVVPVRDSEQRAAVGRERKVSRLHALRRQQRHASALALCACRQRSARTAHTDTCLGVGLEHKRH
jgi:hypothetical protein